MTTQHNPKFQELVAKLREIFQIDRPELDFGIYRIINARAGEINDYLQKRLAEKVQAALAQGGAAQLEQVARELKDKEAQYQADGIDPATVPKVQELRQKLAQYSTGAGEHENAVFSHLLTFFSRYYKDGDFISQRRYKGDTYAIPYAGEEVMLHWANKDQYYTKSGENFNNYSFKLEDGRTVHFRLAAADTAKDNRKDNDKERRFTLITPRTVVRVDDDGAEYEETLLPVEEVFSVQQPTENLKLKTVNPTENSKLKTVNSTENSKLKTVNSTENLIIRFEYTPHPKGTKQEALVAKAVETVLADAAVKARWLALGNRAPTDKNPQRTLLEKHLTDYTTKNTADYFIHKDLGGFLRRELDFYIKNEVMHLDDVQNAGAFADIEKNLRMIQCLRSIALELITFLARLEDFQKKLWLKKKFVVSSHYCITLDRVPHSLYPEIVANEKQWAQWKQLGVWDGNTPGTVEDLKAAPYRMVDTSLFSSEFKAKILSEVSNLEQFANGLLIHGDNFQALDLIRERYIDSVDCVYIDPPYNTAASEILYKNQYKHSSWLSLIHTRIERSIPIIAPHGIIEVAIDDEEFYRLQAMMNSSLGDSNHIANIAIMHNPKGRDKSFIASSHEYTILFAKDINKTNIHRLPLSTTELQEKYPKSDGKRYRELPLRRSGSSASRTDRPYMYYPFLINKSNGKISLISMEEYKKIFVNRNFDDDYVSNLRLTYEKQGYVFILPIRDDGSPGRWRWGYDTSLDGCKNELFTVKGNDNPTIYVKDYANDTYLPKSLWFDSRYDASTKGTNLLKSILPNNQFDYPKSIFAVKDFLIIGSPKNGLICDFFAGSGTTAHATILLNRQDNGSRRYILVEQGEYFDLVLKPRIQKIVYSAYWDDGKPTDPETGISHCFKVLKLESYEDTLNNLQLRRTAEQEDLFGTLPWQAQDDYLLNYMLDVESRGSLLSVEDFRKPFNYTLNIATDSAGAYQPHTIDLVETFNYLIGLRVKHIDAQPQRGFVTVTGTLPGGEICLVLWRDCDILDYEGVSKLCDKLAINPADSEFDVVYINGDHNIPTVLTQTAEEGGATRVLKLRQIEPEFLDRMFSVEDV